MSDLILTKTFQGELTAVCIGAGGASNPLGSMIEGEQAAGHEVE